MQRVDGNRDAGAGSRVLVRALLAIACCAALALTLATRALGAPVGTVTGTVSSAEGGGPVAGIEACTRVDGEEEEGEEEPEELSSCATTAADGTYSIGAVPEGAYLVLFIDPLGSGLNWIPQLYGGSPPTVVTVLAGQTSAGVDQRLSRGGEIEGVVSSAADGAGIEKATVCAFNVAGDHEPGDERCEATGAGGAYTIGGLPAGSYRLGFYAQGYVSQFYGSASLEGATQLPVSLLDVSGPVNAALATQAPGTVLPGGGAATSGSTAPSGAAPGPAGAVTVPPLSLRDRLLAVTAAGSALVQLACPGPQACSGRVRISIVRHARIDGRLHRETLVIARSRVIALAGGAHRTVAVGLSRSGVDVLAAGRGRLAAAATISAPGHSQTLAVHLLSERPR